MRILTKDGDVAASNVDDHREGGLDDRIADQDFVAGDETSRRKKVVNSTEMIDSWKKNYICFEAVFN